MQTPGADVEAQEEMAGLVCSVLDAVVPHLPFAPCSPPKKRGRMFEGEQPCPLRPSAYVQVRAQACWRARVLCRPAFRR